VRSRKLTRTGPNLADDKPSCREAEPHNLAATKPIDRTLIEQMREESDRTNDDPFPTGASPAAPPGTLACLLPAPERKNTRFNAADAAYLPPSTLVRSWITARLEQERPGP
jgi:hypothetical protein